MVKEEFLRIEQRPDDVLVGFLLRHGLLRAFVVFNFALEMPAGKQWRRVLEMEEEDGKRGREVVERPRCRERPVPLLVRDREEGEAPASQELGRRQVHVWTTSLNMSRHAIEKLAALLSPDEQYRARRFLFAKDRKRFTIARGVLRRLLAEYVSSSPKDLQFSYGKHGKPRLHTNHKAAPEFNLSHAGDWASYALTVESPVGIDIEKSYIITTLFQCLAGVDYSLVLYGASDDVSTFLLVEICYTKNS